MQFKFITFNFKYLFTYKGDTKQPHANADHLCGLPYPSKHYLQSKHQLNIPTNIVFSSTKTRPRSIKRTTEPDIKNNNLCALLMTYISLIKESENVNNVNLWFNWEKPSEVRLVSLQEIERFGKLSWRAKMPCQSKHDLYFIVGYAIRNMLFLTAILVVSKHSQSF